MLPRASRLRRSAEFGQVMRRGVRAGSTLLVVHASDRSDVLDTSVTRVGFVVSRTVGDAVTRNRVKRRLRHLTRARLEQLPPHLSVVVRALPAAATADSAALGEALDSGLAGVRRRLGRMDRPEPSIARSS